MHSALPEHGEPGKMEKLRTIKVKYSDGSIIRTSMATNLTDEEMLSYFAIGKWFNIGNVEDNMQQVIEAEILK